MSKVYLRRKSIKRRTAARKSVKLRSASKKSIKRRSYMKKGGEGGKIKKFNSSTFNQTNLDKLLEEQKMNRNDWSVLTHDVKEAMINDFYNKRRKNKKN